MQTAAMPDIDLYRVQPSECNQTHKRNIFTALRAGSHCCDAGTLPIHCGFLVAVHTALCELLGVSIKLMTPPYQFAHRSAIYKFGQESDRVGVNTHAIRFGCKPKKGSVQVWSKCDVRSAILSV